MSDKLAEAKRAIADGFTYTLVCPHCGESAGFTLDSKGLSDYAARLSESDAGVMIQQGSHEPCGKAIQLLKGLSVYGIITAGLGSPFEPPSETKLQYPDGHDLSENAK